MMQSDFFFMTKLRRTDVFSGEKVETLFTDTNLQVIYLF